MSDINIQILQRFIKGEVCNDEELIQLREWLKDSKNNSDISGWLDEVWNKNIHLESNVSFDAIINAIDINIKPSKDTALKRLRLSIKKIAAILLIPLLGLSTYLLIDYQFLGKEYISSVVDKGQKSELILPDGTHIWINSETTVKYSVDYTKEREIFLNGEAYFEVTKQKGKPFVVHAGLIDVKVLGTRFNVAAYPESSVIETALLEGSVQIINENDDTDVILKPGQLSIFSKSSGSSIIKSFKNQDVIGWKTNRLIFKDDTFNNLVKKIERWYNVEVIYDKEKFKNQRLTVELLEGENIYQLMEIVRLTIPLEYKIEKTKIIITSRE